MQGPKELVASWERLFAGVEMHGKGVKWVWLLPKALRSCVLMCFKLFHILFALLVKFLDPWSLCTPSVSRQKC